MQKGNLSLDDLLELRNTLSDLEEEKGEYRVVSYASGEKFMFFAEAGKEYDYEKMYPKFCEGREIDRAVIDSLSQTSN